MAGPVGFHEVIPDQLCTENWKNVIINTGASQSTLQDIKMPEYGGGYVYEGDSAATTNRYIFWRVVDDTIQLWEESLNADLTHSHIQLRIVGLPVLEGISVHERDHQHIIILVSTIASTHCFTLPHPDTLHHNASSSTYPSVLRDLEQHNLREVHTMHLLSTPAVEGGRVHTACSAVADDSNTAVFMFGQPSAALLLLTMDTLPSGHSAITQGGATSSSAPADVFLVKNTSLVNRFLMGFVGSMFRAGEGCDTVHGLCCVSLSTRQDRQMLSIGVCGDGRLRVWSVARRECVVIHDTLEDTAEATARNTPTGERHVLVCRALSSSCAQLAVRLTFVEKQLLLLYRLQLAPVPAPADGSPPPPPVLTHLRTIYPPQHRLVDMSLTDTHVWTLWSDTDTDNKLLYTSLEPSSSCTSGLSAAILSPSPPKGVPNTDPSLDSREVYLQQLFQPYTFSRHTIQRALAMYRGSADRKNTESSDVASLRSQVETVLQSHIETKITPETTEDELYDLTLDTYESFYSHTLQYHQVGQKGMGLACGGGGGKRGAAVGGGVAIVRKQVVSWVSVVDGVEAVVAAATSHHTGGDMAVVGPPPLHHLTQLSQVVVQCGGTSILRGDTATANSVAGVLRCVAVIRSLIDAEVAAAFMLDMSHHSHPEVVAEDVATSLLGQVVGGDEVAAIISSAVCGVHNFTNGLRLLVQALNFDTSASSVDTLHAALNNEAEEPQHGGDEEMEEEGAADQPEERGGDSSGRGQLWCGLVAASLHQLASRRLQLCRDLLVLQQSALRLSHLCQLSPDSVGQLRASIVQDTVLVSRAYHALLCLTRAPAVQPTQQQLHSIRRVLAALALQDNNYTTSSVVTSPQQQSTALYAVLRQGACSGLDSASLPWVTGAGDAVKGITKVAWPLQDRSGSTALLEALVFCGQGEAALHYIRQVCGWCEWSLCSRHFLVGLCLVLQGQYRKAAALLHEAGQGCATEELLGSRVGGGCGSDGARVNYTLRLVRLFEVFSQPSLAVRLATNALAIGQHDLQQLSQLYAVLFKHHLALGHHDEAFTALKANPDPGPQKACLRLLLVTLHQRGCLSTLVNYQYGSLMSDVITILENRARSADILLSNYYHLLYAFHVHKHNYKRAASVMYECAQRLSTEASTQESLKLQLKCYLACINALKLLPKDMAWILKPTAVAPEAGDDPTTEGNGGVKRNVVGDQVVSRRTKRAKVEVLEMPAIDRQCQLVHARLQLAAAGTAPAQHHTGGLSDAQTTVSLLCHGRLYREASRISRLFDLGPSPVLQSLAAACCLADTAHDKIQHEAWLRHNATDSVCGDWWDLLRELLAVAETRPNSSNNNSNNNSNNSVLHADITATLLDRGHTLPPWLLQQYTKRDVGGLLTQLLRYGRLEEAATLALRLLEAVTTGNNCNQVGLLSAVHVTSDAVCLPYTALDRLLSELRANAHHVYYAKALEQLEGKIRCYQTELSRVSRDKVLLMQR